MTEMSGTSTEHSCFANLIHFINVTKNTQYTEKDISQQPCNRDTVEKIPVRVTSQHPSKQTQSISVRPFMRLL